MCWQIVHYATRGENEIAFLPVLHTFFLTKAWQGLFYVCESKRGLGISSRTQSSLNFHSSPKTGDKWPFLTSFSFLTCVRWEMDISHHFYKIRMKFEIFSPTFTCEKGPISCLSWEKQFFHTLAGKSLFLLSLAGQIYFNTCIKKALFLRREVNRKSKMSSVCRGLPLLPLQREEKFFVSRYMTTRYTRSLIHFSCKKGHIPALIKESTTCNKGAIDFF